MSDDFPTSIYRTFKANIEKGREMLESPDFNQIGKKLFIVVALATDKRTSASDSLFLHITLYIAESSKNRRCVLCRGCVHLS